MDHIENEAIYSRNVLELLTVAHEFCLFLESVEKYPSDEVLAFLNKIAPLLYIKGILIPEIEVNNPDANERFVTEEQYENIFLSVKEKFGKSDKFTRSNTKVNEKSILIESSLSEVFADIYQDLKDFVILYQKNTRDAKENAVFSIKELFSQHWGIRLIEAQKHLHLQLYNESEEFYH